MQLCFCLLLCFKSSSFKHVASRKVNPRKSTRAALLVPLFVDCDRTLFQTVKQFENFQDDQCLRKIWGEQEIWVDELVMFLLLWAFLLSSPYWKECLIFKLLKGRCCSPFCLLKLHMFSCWKHLWPCGRCGCFAGWLPRAEEFFIPYTTSNPFWLILCLFGNK